MHSGIHNLIERGRLLPSFLSDSIITAAKVPPSLDDKTAGGVLWQAAPGRFLLSVPGVARYQVEDGQRITIDLTSCADDIAIVRNLNMAPLAALLYQQGMVAFHAAAVANERGAILLAGDSGVGKSTLLMALLQRGWHLLADDLTAAKVGVDGRVIIRPTSHEIALWPDSLERLGIGKELLPAHDVNRCSVSFDNRVDSEDEFTLTTVYWIGLHKNDNCELENVEGSRRFRAMGNIVYNSRIADAQCDRRSYLHLMSAMFQVVPLRRLRRPQGKWSAANLADLVENIETNFAA